MSSESNAQHARLVNAIGWGAGGLIVAGIVVTVAKLIGAL